MEVIKVNNWVETPFFYKLRFTTVVNNFQYNLGIDVETPSKMDAYDTLTQLNFILKLFTLHNIHRKNVLNAANWPFLKMSFIFFCLGIMCVYDMYFYVFSTELLKENLSVKITELLSGTFSCFQYIIDLYFVYKYGRESCVAYYEAYNDMDKNFQMTYHREIRRKVFYSLVMFLSLWVLTASCNYVVWFQSFGWETPMMGMYTYFTFLIRVLTVLELNAHSMHISYRLKTISDVVKNHFSLEEDMLTRIKVEKLSFDVKSRVRIVPFRTRDATKITRLGSYYLLLTQQATFLNKFFGVRVLLHCFYMLTEMITDVNLMARDCVGSMYMTYNSGYLIAVTSFMGLLSCAAILTSMVYYCAQTSQHCVHVVSALDHALINKKSSMEVYSSLQQLRTLVTTRPIRFHAANFFNLDWNLLLSTASIVVTYTVILLQNTS